MSAMTETSSSARTMSLTARERSTLTQFCLASRRSVLRKMLNHRDNHDTEFAAAMLNELNTLLAKLK